MLEDNVFHIFLSRPFGKTSEQKTYWSVFAQAIMDVAKGIDEYEINIHSANNETKGLTLKKNVRNIIDDCDLTIAVLTGKSANIFWEIGYTEAQDKPVIYLIDQDEETLRDSPVLVIEAMKCPYKGSELVDIPTTTKIPEKLAEELGSFIRLAIKAAKSAPRQPKLESFGSREDINLPEIIASAERRIRLITTNLKYFADVNKFTVEIGGDEKFAFDVAVERGVDINILTLDPESPIAKYRAEQLKLDYDVGIYRKELKDSAIDLYHRYRNSGNVSIRIYDDLPLHIALIVDDQVMTSMIARGSRSRENLHFLMDLDLFGADVFEKHFEAVFAGPGRHISSYKWAD